MFDSIIKAFKRIGVAIVFVKDPIRFIRGPLGKSIFQMDIERVKSGSMGRIERFRIYPGDKTNKIQVLGVDDRTRQLVLLVKEEAREFEDERKITKWSTEENMRADLKREKFYGVRKIGNRLIFKGKSPGNARHFLLGFDERCLFIAQLQRAVTTVNEAHNVLQRTATIQFANRKKVRGSFDRQGEWMFIETSQALRDEIDAALRQTRTAVRYDVKIGDVLGRPGGNPHVVDQLVKLKISKRTTTPGGNPLLRERVFIKGRVRHSQHKTKTFSQWREVIKNDEGATGSGSAAGIFWID